MQQWRKLRERGIKDPRPRQQTLDDLTEFLKSYEKDGNEIIVMMDANDPITSTAMDTFLDDLNLYDLMADYLPPNPPSTYQRGQHKIDHIVGTMGVNIIHGRTHIPPHVLRETAISKAKSLITEAYKTLRKVQKRQAYS
jgi:hypothetical protein